MTRKAARNGFELSETRRTLPIALLRARETVMERFRPMLSAPTDRSRCVPVTGVIETDLLGE